MMSQGRYSGTPITWGTAKSKPPKETPYAWVEFNVTHILNDDIWLAICPCKRTVFFYLTERAYDISMQKLDQLGFNGDFGPNMNFSETIKIDGVALDCEHETYENRPKERWNIAYDGGSMEHSMPSNDVIDKLNAMYKNRKEQGGIPF